MIANFIAFKCDVVSVDLAGTSTKLILIGWELVELSICNVDDNNLSK